MIQDAKKKNIPAPGAYKIAPILGNVRPSDRRDDRQEKFCGFIEDAVVHSQQNPKSKVDINYRQVDKKNKAAVMWAESEKQKQDGGGRVSPIPKIKTPAPGDFAFNKPEDSFKKSQLSPSNFQFGRDKPACFTEVYSRRKSYIPGSGHYKFDSNTLKRISGSPKSVAMKRH